MPKTCDACQKTYSNAHNLRQHHERQPLCAKWLSIPNGPGLKEYIDQEFSLPVVEGESERSKLYCGVCQTQFTCSGNLNRHMKERVMCQKWAKYRELTPLTTYLLKPQGSDEHIDAANGLGITYQANGESKSLVDLGRNEEFVAPAFKLNHILWNLFLVDKELVAKPDFPAILRSENVKYMISILPVDPQERNTADGRSIDTICHQIGMDIELMEYSDHTPIEFDNRTKTEFDRVCRNIEHHRSKRENVFIFCNSGYQRSIPFLVYFFTRFHPEEAPTIERALDLILPQVAREEFAKVRPQYVESITNLLPLNYKYQNMVKAI